MSLMTRFQTLIQKLRSPGEQSHLLEVDQSGNLLVSDSLRYFVAVTDGTPFPHGPCDALILSAASAVTVIGDENTSGEGIALSLQAGINRVCCSEVVSAVGSPTIVAGYMRRPPGA